MYMASKTSDIALKVNTYMSAWLVQLIGLSFFFFVSYHHLQLKRTYTNYIVFNNEQQILNIELFLFVFYC